MKTILTLIFVLFIGVAAQAQNGAAEVEVETVTMSVVAATAKQYGDEKSENYLALLYIFKNSIITIVLSFSMELIKV